MKNTRIAVAALLALTLIASGCADQAVSKQKEKALSGEVDTSRVNLGDSFFTEAKATEANHQELVQEEPIPKMGDSLERKNLKKRYKTLNDQNEVFHVYLMSHGKVVSYFPAQGKVSSVNSKLTQSEQIVTKGNSGQGEQNDYVVSSPQLDGSYGTNGDGVFFFTTDGSYVEWNGEYITSERPLDIKTPLSLEADVNVTQ